MRRKKVGRKILLVGLALLIMALLLIFLTEGTPWAPIILVLSILTNTVAICMLTWK